MFSVVIEVVLSSVSVDLAAEPDCKQQFIPKSLLARILRHVELEVARVGFG